jgi:hypothetical protein
MNVYFARRSPVEIGQVRADEKNRSVLREHPKSLFEPPSCGRQENSANSARSKFHLVREILANDEEEGHSQSVAFLCNHDRKWIRAAEPDSIPRRGIFSDNPANLRIDSPSQPPQIAELFVIGQFTECCARLRKNVWFSFGLPMEPPEKHQLLKALREAQGEQDIGFIRGKCPPIECVELIGKNGESHTKSTMYRIQG